MSTEKISLGINLRQNKNSRNAATYGRFYPEIDVQKTLSLRGFARHMTDHKSEYSRATVEGVLYQICECLPELIAQGVPVKLGSLGTFYPTAQVKKGHGILSVADMDGLDPNDLVHGIRIRFLPDSTRMDNLCGPAFKKACSLELRNIVDTQQVTVNGIQRKVQTLKPVATAVAEYQAGLDNGSGSGGNGGSGSDPIEDRP